MLYNEINVLDFLTEIYSLGKSYSVLNTARSALSTFLIKDSGLSIGNSPIIKRFMKGIFELTPPLPRYKIIWDTSIVLDFLANYYPYNELSLTVLTQKCAMLLALTSMQRTQTLLAISLDDIKYFDDCILITIHKTLKQFRIGRNSLTINLKYYSNPSLCPCSTLVQYINKTKPLRKNIRQLFISYNQPYNSVTSATIGRWLKNVMYEAGIDTNYFKAHSTRAAASSAAFDADIDVNEIIQMADWSNVNTFKKFYNKVVF